MEIKRDEVVKYKTKKVQKEVEDIIICDRCGTEQKIHHLLTDIDFIEIRHQYGYGSPKDGDYIEADIYETCFDEVVRDSNINVRRYENGLVSVEDFKAPWPETP